MLIFRCCGALSGSRRPSSYCYPVQLAVVHNSNMMTGCSEPHPPDGSAFKPSARKHIAEGLRIPEKSPSAFCTPVLATACCPLEQLFQAGWTHIQPSAVGYKAAGKSFPCHSNQGAFLAASCVSSVSSVYDCSFVQDNHCNKLLAAP